MRLTLLYNPKAGRAQNHSVVESIATILRQHHHEIQTIPTEAPGIAGQQAQHLANHADILFACGGDGTIHEVLQGLIHHPTCTLGILPLGSANALARHLRLPLDPIAAALQQLLWHPRMVPVGHITCATSSGERSRYFIVMAGAGPDGALVYRMLSQDKHSLGRLSYYLRAARLFATTQFPAFLVTTPQASCRAVSAMAVRVADLGGLFSPLASLASIDHPHLTVTLTQPPATLGLPAWFTLSWVRLPHLNPFTRTLTTSTFTATPLTSTPIQVQADGEHLGRLPMTITLVPNALRLLLPTTP